MVGSEESRACKSQKLSTFVTDRHADSCRLTAGAVLPYSSRAKNATTRRSAQGLRTISRHDDPQAQAARVPRLDPPSAKMSALCIATHCFKRSTCRARTTRLVGLCKAPLHCHTLKCFLLGALRGTAWLPLAGIDARLVGQYMGHQAM
jgi:hypothetical protein